MPVGDSWYESDGKAVNVTLSATVAKGRVIVAQGWVGIAGSNGVSGQEIALIADDREYRVQVPAGLAVAKGNILYVEVADVTGHYPDDTAFSTTPGAGKVAFMKATAAKDANNRVTGVMLAHNAFENAETAA